MSKTIYFIGDLHLGHKRILEFGQRKASSIEEHDEQIVETWNSVVKKDKDICWVLGDVAMSRGSLALLNHMNGEKRLILGNHDTFPLGEYAMYFSQIAAFHKGYKGLVLTHIPIHDNELVYRNWEYNIHGHVHHPEKVKDYSSKHINVNWDIVQRPISLEEIRAETEKRACVL